jgi:hypothetical protein
VGDFLLSETRYASGAALETHAHDYACVVVVLAGTFRERAERRERECAQGTVIVRPEGEPHSNRFERSGGRCLNVELAPRWVARVREYLMSGGFLHVDDNYGLNESFRREVARVFPDRELIELPASHPVYRSYYEFPDGLPKIHEHDGKPAQGFGIFHEGRLVLFYSYETDLGDGWEDPEVHDDPAEAREAALRMGVNLFVFALTQAAG